MRKEFSAATAQHSTAQAVSLLCKKWKVQLLYMLIQSNPFIAMR